MWIGSPLGFMVGWHIFNDVNFLSSVNNFDQIRWYLAFFGLFSDICLSALFCFLVMWDYFPSFNLFLICKSISCLWWNIILPVIFTIQYLRNFQWQYESGNEIWFNDCTDSCTWLWVGCRLRSFTFKYIVIVIDTLHKGLGNSLILKRKGLVLNGVTLMAIQTTKTALFPSQLQWFLCFATEFFIFLLPCTLITSFLDNMVFLSPFISSCSLVSGQANRKNQIMTMRKQL